MTFDFEQQRELAKLRRTDDLLQEVEHHIKRARDQDELQLGFIRGSILLLEVLQERLSRGDRN